MGKPTKILHNVAVGVVVEYYDLDETYKEYEEYKYKEYQGKCLKNFSGGGNVRGVFVLGG